MRLNEINQKDPNQVLIGLKIKDPESIKFAQSIGIPPAVIDKFAEMEQKVDQVQDERVKVSAKKLEDILYNYISKASKSILNKPVGRRTFFKGAANFASFIANMDKILSLVGKIPATTILTVSDPVHVHHTGSIFLKTIGDGYWSNVMKDVKIERIEISLSDFSNNYGDTEYPEDDLFGEMRVYFDADSWDVEEHGLIYTDNLWERELQDLLRELYIKNYEDVYYSEQGMQGNDYVSLDIGSKAAAEFTKHPNFKKTGDEQMFAEFDILADEKTAFWKKDLDDE